MGELSMDRGSQTQLVAAHSSSQLRPSKRLPPLQQTWHSCPKPYAEDGCQDSTEGPSKALSQDGRPLGLRRHTPHAPRLARRRGRPLRGGAAGEAQELSRAEVETTQHHRDPHVGWRQWLGESLLGRGVFHRRAKTGTAATSRSPSAPTRPKRVVSMERLKALAEPKRKKPWKASAVPPLEAEAPEAEATAPGGEAEKPKETKETKPKPKAKPKSQPRTSLKALANAERAAKAKLEAAEAKTDSTKRSKPSGRGLAPAPASPSSRSPTSARSAKTEKSVAFSPTGKEVKDV
ncbi:unnamed protein product [Durusdinium trenchii]|uniref:Uncharacterized protein n=1 Tax=Durusdinium trenchii TaxID=1381693 RepID=A0ABP0IN25_9DINO